MTADVTLPPARTPTPRSTVLEHLRLLGAVVPDALVVVDLEGHILLASREAEAMFGYANDELLGQAVETLIPGAARGRHRDERAGYADQPHNRPMGSGLDLRGLRKDGTTFPVDISLSSVETGDGVLLCSAIRDVSEHRRMEGELRARQRFIEAVAAASPPVIYVFDLDQLRLTYSNRSILAELGYDGPVGDTNRLDDFKRFMRAEDLPRLEPILAAWRGLIDGQVREDEYCLVDAGGRTHWFMGRETVFSRRADGAVQQVLGTLNDITEHKNASQALEHSWTLLRSFVEHTPAAVAMLDKDLKYIATSRRWLQDYGLGERDLAGQHHYDVFPEIRNLPHWQRLHQSALAGAIERSEEDLFVRADGRTDWLRWEMRPWRDDKGAIGGVIMFTEVITERKLAEERLRDSQRHLLASQRIAHVGSWEVDFPLKDFGAAHPRWSDECCRIFGYEPGEFEVTSESFWSRMHRDDKVRVEAAIRQVIDEPASVHSIDHRIVLANGTVRTVQHTAELVLNPATGTPLKIVGTVQDTTDRLRIDAQLRQSQKMQAIGQLAGGVAHDFNNLLTVINTCSEMLLEDAAPDDPARRRLSAIRDAGERAAGLTRQLLTFSRKAAFNPVVLDCNQLVQRLTAMLRRMIGEDVALSTVLAPTLPRIKADAGQIDQVVMNLSLNARDAMPEGGRLTLETKAVSFDAEYCRAHPEHAPGAFVQLSVSDTGHGMSQEVKQHLFEPFFTTKELGRGTGLGLATVYGIVQESGGFITVSSEVGRGTTFAVFLPAAGDAEGAVVSEPPDPRRARGKETALLVEDDAALRRVMRFGLEKFGYTVLEASDGATGLEMTRAGAGPIDVIVTDVVMPGMSGFELVDRVQAERPQCRALLMSGYAEKERIDRGARLTTDVFIQKPFTAAALAAKVREVLDSSPLPT
jgi:PAS domain S-box-containing protein